jgi:hypothetical protein
LSMYFTGRTLWGRRRSRLPWAEMSRRKGTDRACPASLGGGRIQQGASGDSFFPRAQPLRRRLGFRQPFPAADATGLGVFDSDFLLFGDRRNFGQVVEVCEDSGQHPKDTGMGRGMTRTISAFLKSARRTVRSETPIFRALVRSRPPGHSVCVQPSCRITPRKRVVPIMPIEASEKTGSVRTSRQKQS